MITVHKALFGRIDDREAAIDLAKWAAHGFFLAAAFAAFLALFALPRLLFVSPLYAICGYFTHFKFSRVAVVAGVCLSAVCFLLTSRFPESRNSMVFALVIWGGVRGIEATFKLHGKFSLQSSSQKT